MLPIGARAGRRTSAQDVHVSCDKNGETECSVIYMTDMAGSIVAVCSLLRSGDFLVPSISELLAESALDPEAVAILSSAFEAAWTVVEKSGSPLAEPGQAMTTRERMAKRIIELGQRGERSHQRLVDAALDTLTQGN